VHFKPPADIDKQLKYLKTKNPNYWLKKGRENLINLIKFTINSTPAYRKFLQENGINFKKINSLKDFQKLPIMNKDNYLRKFSYLDLFPYRNVNISTTISATSGSTGEPFYFPRYLQHDFQHIYILELILKNQFEIDKKSSLVVICFGLGIWIGGIINYKTFDVLSNKYKITILPIGTNKETTIKSLLKFGRYFDQIILLGYPPFIKDLADELSEYQSKLKTTRFRIINAAEGFPEELRKYFAKKFRLENMINDNVNIYGTIELHAMAHETAFSNLIRHIAVEKDKVFHNIFREVTRTPTLAQYHPYIIWFEEKDGQILASGYGSSIPLIRYSFLDIGGVIYFDEMLKRLKEVGIDIFKEAEKFGIKNKILKLPFVYVYERSDFAVSLVGINIYPEYIMKALLTKNLQKYCTEKFSMQVVYDKTMDQRLHIHIELKKNIAPNMKIEKLIKKEVINSLLTYSTEYHHLYSTSNETYKKQIEPIIFLHFYEDPQYFKPGIKQKWTIK
ncbi:MAG: hypothetical protein ACK4ZM_03820, partial [bacterium]